MDLFERNRYDSSAVLKAFDSSLISKGVKETREGKANLFVIDQFAIDGDKLEILFPLPGEVQKERLEFARDVCAHITEFDNLVQQSCQKDFETSPPDDSYLEYLQSRKLPPAAAFALRLAYIIIEGAVAKLHYDGIYVDSEWDAVFKRDDTGSWQKVNF